MRESLMGKQVHAGIRKGQKRSTAGAVCCQAGTTCIQPCQPTAAPSPSTLALPPPPPHLELQDERLLAAGHAKHVDADLAQLRSRLDGGEGGEAGGARPARLGARHKLGG